MTDLDGAIVAYAVRRPLGLTELQRAGITSEHLTDDYAKAWDWAVRMKRQHGSVPSLRVVQQRYADLDLSPARQRDVPMLVSEVKQRKKLIDFHEAIEVASSTARSVDDIDRALSQLQLQLNGLNTRGMGETAVVDLFSRSAKRRMMRDLKQRRSGKMIGIPTGLKRFDYVTGGLGIRKMYVVMARTGVGKSWLNLLFVASAVLAGKKVVLYPLEMTLEETALRLYTIFSQKMFGNDGVIKNLDLTMGRFSPRRAVRLMNALEDRFAGQLFVADVASLTDPYTPERVESEVELYQPDMFWVDYLTLMKAPNGRSGAEDYTSIKALSNAIKGIAQRQACVGGASAQVNRDAMKIRSLIPRVEHISYGDSIGHDADGILSLGRKDQHLYYGLVKHRGGPEIGRTRLKAFFDSGLIEEDETQDHEDDE
jgi:replicative DNA helicase